VLLFGEIKLWFIFIVFSRLFKLIKQEHCSFAFWSIINEQTITQEYGYTRLDRRIYHYTITQESAVIVLCPKQSENYNQMNTPNKLPRCSQTNVVRLRKLLKMRTTTEPPSEMSGSKDMADWLSKIRKCGYTSNLWFRIINRTAERHCDETGS